MNRKISHENVKHCFKDDGDALKHKIFFLKNSAGLRGRG